MDELVKLVSKKTGLPEAQARTAVKTVVDYLKKKLPAPVAAQIEPVLNSGQAASAAAGLLKGVEGAVKQIKKK